MTGVQATDALRTLLAGLPDRLPIDRVDRIWVFPPKEIAGQESGLVALSLHSEGASDGDRRQLLTLRYQCPRGRRGAEPTVEVTEQGWAPADRLGRVIGGAVARLSDADDPFEFAVDRQPDRLALLLDLLTGSEVDRANGE